MALKAREYTGPECPACGAWLDRERMSPGEQRCGACGKVFLATPFSPPEVRLAVGRVAEAGPEGAAPCPRHAGNAAVANCSRCGIFMCGLCRIDIEGQELCPGCFDRLSAEGALASARNHIRDYRGMALSLGVFGLLVSCFGLLTGPATLYLVTRAVQQRREWNETGGGVSLAVAAFLGLGQIAFGLFVVIALFVDSGAQ